MLFSSLKNLMCPVQPKLAKTYPNTQKRLYTTAQKLKISYMLVVPDPILTILFRRAYLVFY